MQALTRSACRTFLAPARSFTQHKRFATKMGLKSDHEDKLISLSKQFNKAFGQKDTSKLDGLLSPRVVLHADKVTLMDNVSGRGSVMSVFKAFFDKYDYQRVEGVGAVDENDNIAFSVSVDKGVVPKGGVHEGQKPDQVKPSNVINLTALELNSDNLISDIWIARQLSVDEAHRKLKKVPDYHGSSFNPEEIGNDDIEPSPERAQHHEHYASLWNKMFTDNDVSKAEEICDPNVKVHNLLVSQESTGLDAWKGQLSKIFENWECEGNRHAIAVTPGNKGFIWWETTGQFKGEWCTVWGITMLTFNKDKISEAASIYQPFPGMREELVKAA